MAALIKKLEISLELQICLSRLLSDMFLSFYIFIKCIIATNIMSGETC